MTVERQQAEILEARMQLDSERLVSAQWQDRALAAVAAEPCACLCGCLCGVSVGCLGRVCEQRRLCP